MLYGMRFINVLLILAVINLMSGCSKDIENGTGYGDSIIDRPLLNQAGFDPGGMDPGSKGRSSYCLQPYFAWKPAY